MELEDDLICPPPHLAKDESTVGTLPGLRKNYVSKISLPDDYIQRSTNQNSTFFILRIKSIRVSTCIFKLCSKK